MATRKRWKPVEKWTFHVVLPSGRAAVISVPRTARVQELKIASQGAMRQGTKNSGKSDVGWKLSIIFAFCVAHPQ